MIRTLIKFGSDYRALNFYGLNVMHVAAQGDQPVSLVILILSLGLFPR